MTVNERTEVLATLKGLLAIAKLAMPDTYYMTDRRVRRALRLLNAQRAYAKLMR